MEIQQFPNINLVFLRISTKIWLFLGFSKENQQFPNINLVFLRISKKSSYL
jgi:hypothetical protein